MMVNMLVEVHSSDYDVHKTKLKITCYNQGDILRSHDPLSG